MLVRTLSVMCFFTLCIIQPQLKEHCQSYEALFLSLFLYSVDPHPFLLSLPPSPFVCFWDVDLDKTLCLTGPNLQFGHGTCGLFMCLTCHCFCKAWHELIESVSVSVCVCVCEPAR